eukprot:CAMPEP_0182874854 /NCGR_PEP_ID=MMETSP0034_2-20130328/13194_1 /TAXON_ID=156128 /ORGANISM="Nephroselmis pyriformis, Strain CCMP717" /LENGTH=79 /DNA_ID=CAMNT_0025007581 /DNA_START=188 /DNA_END=424 /DNA_ORIENTATION=-
MPPPSSQRLDILAVDEEHPVLKRTAHVFFGLRSTTLPGSPTLTSDALFNAGMESADLRKGGMLVTTTGVPTTMGGAGSP